MKRALRCALLGSMLATVALCVLMQDIPLTGGRVASGETTVPPASQQRATEQITVHVAGRGHPWINLRDGYDLPTAYTGASGQVLEQGVTKPLALAAGDFDEDGVPDLVCGYTGPSGSILTLHRGNVDAIYPNSPEAQQRKVEGTFTDAPFLSPARVFAVPEAPEFLGTGDFDADGHGDVVVAAYGGKALYWLAGDGQGGFGPAQHIELPGTVTALVTGEMNRADGLMEVVVGISGPDGPQALVFEGPEGALKGEPEALALPSEATALALGQLDEDSLLDLAIAAGKELVIVHGRDRRLSLDEIRQAEVPRATLDQHPFPFAIASVALGDFLWDQEHRTEVALLSADGTVHLVERQSVGTRGWSEAERQQVSEAAIVPASGGPGVAAPLIVRTKVSSLLTDDLMVVDRAKHQLHILMMNSRVGAEGEPIAPNPPPVTLDVEGEPMVVLPMRLNADALSDLVILKTDESGPTVALTGSAITFTVNSTADTDDGICNATNCTLREAINATNANGGFLDTINFSIGSGVQTINVGITGLGPLPDITDPVTIDGTTQPGFVGTPIIQLSGGSAGVNADGLRILAGSSTVRGLVINSFNGDGIELGGFNVIEGNFIGTNAAGTATPGNSGDGMHISLSGGNTIGGTTAGARNVISGNGMNGVEITGGGNRVVGNFIGTDVTGSVDLGNSRDGVLILFSAILSSEDNTIGGATLAERNVISGNDSNGVKIGGLRNRVQGNFIGTDVTGTHSLRNNFDGVFISGSIHLIGGTTAGARNVISGNGRNGVELNGSGANGNQVQGNFIGTDVTGTHSLRNNFDGVFISESLATQFIGGTTAGARNVISGNGRNGVELNSSDASENQVQGNFIGTDVTGTHDLGNAAAGVEIINAPHNHIGGTEAGARNLISGNHESGVVITIEATENLVEGNYIGTDVNGTAALGNTLAGVDIASFASNNTIGGTHSGAGNIIAFNGGDGVLISSGTGNAILSNSMFSNGALGIDLAPNGVTPNDSGDGDSGANTLQNFPALTLATSAGGPMTINGVLISRRLTTFVLQFFSNAACDPSGFGEGQTFIGSTTVVTDLTGIAPLAVTFSTSVPAGQFITATATDPSGNTSEFSTCRVVTQVQPQPVPGVSVTGLSASASPTPGCSGPGHNPHCPLYDVDLRATIANPGQAPASPVQVLFEFSTDGGASFTRIGGLANVGTIPAGGTASAATTWKNVSPGPYLVRVTGDPNDLIEEADETNNVSEFTVNVP